jgi:hypothetical protein
MVGKILSVCVAFAMAALPTAAACSQANAVGTWKLYSASADSRHHTKPALTLGGDLRDENLKLMSAFVM